MSRATMADLIERLRGLTEAGTGDWSLGTAVFWDGDQLERVLERQRGDYFREAMAAVESYSGGGTVVWKDYYLGVENVEETVGGTAVFYVEDAAGAKVGTALWSADYARGKVSFVNSTGGSSYYWYGRAYDLNRAAAEVWRMKAGHFAGDFDFATDNHNVKKGAVYEHCLRMAEFYEGRAGRMAVVTMYRSDVEEG